MSPRAVVFDRQAIVSAALQLVREEGWDALTARRVGEKLGASVAPVYKAFGAMGDLELAILEEARGLLEEYTRRHYTEMDFLNIGVGVVEFARAEPNLFRAIYLERHGRAEIIQALTGSILSRMRAQPMLDRLPEASLRRLLDRVRLYTLGMASAILAGGWTDSSTEAVVRQLMEVGSLFTLAELNGTADCLSPQSREAWQRVLGPDARGESECPLASRPVVSPPARPIDNDRFFEED